MGRRVAHTPRLHGLGTYQEHQGSQEVNWEADIMDASGEDLITVDLRTLDDDKLRALRKDAWLHGDTEMVHTIDRLLKERMWTRK